MKSSNMISPVRKRSVVINGRKTSVSLEAAFWTGLREIAALRGVALADLASQVDRERDAANLSSALRLRVLAHYKNLAST
jgi:predicted DNA-binding ribbon-helix-helix protein